MHGPRRQFGGVYNTMFILGAIGLAAMIGIKVTPIYLNQMKVEAAVKQISESPQYSKATPLDIRKALQRRWDVEDVRHLAVKDIKLVKIKSGRALRYKYEVRDHLVANWDLVLTFEDEKEITGRSTD